MNSKILILLFLIHIYKGYSLKRKNSTTIIFRSHTIVHVNKTNFSELNFICERYSLKHCSKIKEVICSEKFNKLINNSCIVANRESKYFNKSVINERAICNSDILVKGQCYLKFELPKFNESELMINSRKSIFDSDPFFSNHQREFDQRFRQMKQDQEARSKKWDEDWARRKAQNDSIGDGFMIVFAVVAGFIVIFSIIAICRGVYEETGCSCSCFKSKPIISENARRLAFPRSNFTVSMPNSVQAGTSLRSSAQDANYPAFNNTTNFKTDPEFSDPPPKYDQAKYAEPPSYSSLTLSNIKEDNLACQTNSNQMQLNQGISNQSYVPETVQSMHNVHTNVNLFDENRQMSNSNKPSAPNF